MPPAAERAGRSAAEIHELVARFLEAAADPAVLEPGEEILRIAPGCRDLQLRSERVLLQVWDERRNLVRRITGVALESRGRLELVVERFARKQGRLILLDLARPAAQPWERRGSRMLFRERFRHFLTRQFPGWALAELSTEADLEHTLSPAYPRAFLKRGKAGMAAIASAPDYDDPDGALTFGLIWLHYLRKREPRLAVEGLSVFLPAWSERTTGLRLRWLDRTAARFHLFVYTVEDYAAAVDAADVGNVETRLETVRRPVPADPDLLERLSAMSGVETLVKPDGSYSLRVRGLEFACTRGAELLAGLGRKAPVRDYTIAQVETLARELLRIRAAEAGDREQPLWRQQPEAWLESQVRAHLERIDPSLLSSPLYGQVPTFAGIDRGIIDLLASDAAGRLAVLELKASADLHLPLQALDYWMRVNHHACQGEFGEHGYFPGVALRREPPRLLLISPELEFHPTTETLLAFFSPQVPVERIGVGSGWRGALQVVHRQAART